MPKLKDIKSEEGVTISKLYKGKVEVKFFGPTDEKPNRHMYYMNGERKTGVTTYINILDKSRVLMNWKGQRTTSFLLNALKEGRVTKEIICAGAFIDTLEKEEAGRVGKLAHEWISNHIGGKNPEIPEDENVLTAVNAFLDWQKGHKVEFVSSERVLYSKKHDYMGTLDGEALIDGKRFLVDFKTSTGLYNSVRMQTAAYQWADEEENERKTYKGRIAIRIAKYDEAEYLAKENEKKEIKKLLANYQGKEFKDYEINPYQVFESEIYDNESLADDFKAFLFCKGLHEWNKSTTKYGKDD